MINNQRSGWGKGVPANQHCLDSVVLVSGNKDARSARDDMDKSNRNLNNYIPFPF